MKPAIRILWRCVLIVWLGLAFMTLTTWLGCEPLDELPSAEAGNAPMNAKCFRTNHGAVSFYEHGTIGDEPLQFSFYLSLLLVPWALLTWDLWRAGILKRWFSRRAGNNPR